MSLQGVLFPPASDWRPRPLSDLPQDWSAFSRVGLDTETCDPDLKTLGPGVRRGAYLAGYSLSFPGWGSVYQPLRHLGGDNVENPDAALDYLRHNLATYQGDLVGAHLGYDLDFLAQADVNAPQARIRDVLVAEPLIDELQMSYSLDSVLARRGLPLKDEALLSLAAREYGLKNVKKELWKLPGRFVGPYAEADADRPLLLLEAQEREIEKYDLGRVWQLECEVLPILVRMTRRGVRVNLDKVDRIDRWSQAQELMAWGELQRHSGRSVRVGDAMKAEVVAHALEPLGVQIPLTATRKPSITKLWLEAQKHPAFDAVRRARKMSQLRTTFVASVRDHQVRGRIHCTFNQVAMEDDSGSEEGVRGVRYGRLSCQDPNLQQQPARDEEIGPMWRDIYEPEEGGLWCSPDFSQQEPRGALHFALASGPSRLGRALAGRRPDLAAQMGLRAYRSAEEAVRRYREDPKADAHTMFVLMVEGDDYLGDPGFKHRRTILKNTYLGICYGMGGPRLCREVGLPTQLIERHGRTVEVAGPEGQALMDRVDERVPYVRATAKAVEAVAAGRGYIITVGGRHLHFPKDAHGNYDFTHKAFNRAIQGTAADQVKRAMVEVDRMGYYMQLQVHDELPGTVGSPEEGLRVGRAMEECFPLLVPSRVDVEMGPSWGRAK